MPKLPSVVSKLPNDLKQFLERVREALTGEGWDRFVTARDLVSSGIAKDINLTPGATGEVYGTPPAPTNVQADGALANIILTWDRPVYRGHSHAEVWAAGVDDLGQAVVIGMAPGAIFVHNIGGGATRYYWVRFVNLNGVAGPYNGTAGTLGQTGQDPAYLLELLAGEITESQLYQSLSERIDLIDAGDWVVGSVNARIKTAKDAAIGAAVDARDYAEDLAVKLIGDATDWAISKEGSVVYQLQQADGSEANDRKLLASIVLGADVDPDNLDVWDRVVSQGLLYEEQFARSEADKNEVQSRELLSATLIGQADVGACSIPAYTSKTACVTNGGVWTATPPSLADLKSGLMYTERVLRQDAVDNLAKSISLLSVGAAQGMDVYRTFYFDDGTLEGWVGTGVTITNDQGYLAQTSVTGATYAARYIERTGLEFSGGKYNTARMRVKRVSGSGWDWRLTFQANGSWQTGVTAPSQTVAVGDFATVDFDLSGVSSWMGGTITGVRIYTSQSISDRWNFDYIAVGRVGPAASTAMLYDESQARIEDDGAMALRIGSLESLTNVGVGPDGNPITISAAINSLDEAITNPDTGAIATSIDDAFTTYMGVGADGEINTLSSYVANELNSITGPDGAIATNNSYLRSYADSTSAKIFRQASAPTRRGVSSDGLTIQLQEGDLWYDTTEGNNTPKVYNGTSWVVTQDKAISTVDARVNTVETTLIGYCVDANGRPTDYKTKGQCEVVGSGRTWVQGIPFATAVKQVGVQVGGETVALETKMQAYQSSIGGLEAQYTVKIDANGYVSGFGLASTAVNGTPFSEFIVKADRFAIGSPQGEVIPFVVQTTPTTSNGESVPAGVYMDAAYIKNGTITRAKIGNAVIDDAKIASLSAAKVTFGEMSGDRITVGSLNADRITTNTLSAKLAQITDAYVGTAQIADAAITNAKIGNVIQSSNYVAGSTGWKIDKAGAMEMNDATFRGTLDVKNAASGARLEIKNNVIKVFDANGVLRVKIGDLSA